jgi:hypothetical protein
MAFEESILIAARFPLFPLLLSGLFRIFPPGMRTLRVFTASLNLISVLLLFVLVARAQKNENTILPYLAAGLYAIYPKAVLYSRIGFSYHLVTVLILLACLGLFEYLRSKNRAWIILAAGAIGLALVTDLIGALWIIPLVLVITAVRFRGWLWSLSLVILPFLVYLAHGLIRAPVLFGYDLNFILRRTNSIPLVLQFPVMLINYGKLLRADYWLAPALAGLFLLKPRRFKRLILLMFLVPFFLVNRSIALTELGFYYFIPFFPWVALGMASLLYYGTPKVVKLVRAGLADLLTWWGWEEQRNMSWWRNRLLNVFSALFLFILLVAPFLLSVFSTVQSVESGFTTPFDQVLVEGNDARVISNYVNFHAGPSDLVVTSPTLGWLIDAEVADFQMVLAYQNSPTLHFPADIPKAHFAYSADYRRAKFAVVDPVWRNWGAVNMPAVAVLLEEVQDWPLVYQQGDIYVYQNPAWNGPEK